MQEENTTEDVEQREVISPYLYFAGFLVVLCGLIAVSEALDRPGFAPTMIPLAALGFAFSFACRWWNLRSPWLRFSPVCIVAFVVQGVAGDTQNTNGFSEQLQTQEAALFLAGLVVLLGWCMVRDSVVLFCCVPALVTISLAASVTLSSTTAACYFVYLLAATFVLTHYNYLAQLQVASRGGETPDLRRVLLGHLAIAGACSILAFAIGTTLVVPFSAFARQLSVTETAKEMAAIAAPHHGGGMNVMTSFTESNRFGIGYGDFGSINSTVLMKMAPSDHAPHYWTGRTYDNYAGDGWTSKRETSPYIFDAVLQDDSSTNTYQLPASAEADLGLGREAPEPPTVKTSVEVTGNTDQFYYTGLPRSLDLASRPAETPDMAADGRLDAGQGVKISSNYTIVSNLNHDPNALKDRERITHAGTEYPSKIREYYLASSINPITTKADVAYFRSAVKEALGNSPANRMTPLDKVEAIQSWITHRCVYSLKQPTEPAKVDHVHYFLETSKKGYCDLFASAMAVLCRTAGVPARVVTGFAPGEPEPDGATFNVRIKDKHAWVEVFFPGTGWVTFDPTAAAPTDGSDIDTTVANLSWKARLGDLIARNKLPFMVMLIILGLLMYVFKTEVLDRRRVRRAVSLLGGVGGMSAGRAAILDRYWRMLQAASWLEFPRHSETPAEFSARLKDRMAAEELALGVSLKPDVVDLLTAHFVLARYGNEAAAAPLFAEAAAAESVLSEFTTAARGGQIARFMQTVGLRRKNKTVVQS